MNLNRSAPRRWLLRPEPTAVPTGDFPPLIGRLLAYRGVRTAEEADRFLEGEAGTLRDPYRLPGMERAVARLESAARGEEIIAVFGDFDVDGVTAAALLVPGLARLGIRSIPYLPNRFSEGYGLNKPAIAALRRRGATVLLAVDCGTSSTAEVTFACEQGMDVLVVDHHQPPSALPPAQALVNPRLLPAAEPGAELASAGLALWLLAALHEALGRPFSLDEHLDLVTLGTVCDMAPLVDENRELVRRGLVSLGRTSRPGLRALMEVAGVDGSRMDSEVVSFVLGPRLNAAGRLTHADLSYQLLTCEGEVEALALARRLNDLNRERQGLTREALELAGRLLEADPAGADAALLMVGHPDISSGIAGLVASRLADVYHRPAVVFEEGEEQSRASARSIPGFDIVGALRGCSDLLLRFGGHPQAAGFTAESARLPAIRERLLACAERELAGEELMPRLEIDAELALRDLRGEEIRWLGRLGPHGIGNPQPAFLSRGVVVMESGVVGSEGRHLRLKLRDGPLVWPAIAFGLGEVAPTEGHLVNVVYSLAGDRGISGGLELQVKDLAPAR